MRMKRLFATKINLRRMPYGATLDMRPITDDPIWWVKDFAEDHIIYYFAICTASSYSELKRRYKDMSDWIEFDYFNLNKIEE